MKAIILCEGTTDLLMIQFVLQYKYGWQYDGFVENTVTNQLIRRNLIRGNDSVEINSCGGIMNIPSKINKIKDKMCNATSQEEIYNKVIVMIDHDTVSSNQEFINQLNDKAGENFETSQLNVWSEWLIESLIFGETCVDLYLGCIPSDNTGAIETIMLEALATDQLEIKLISDTRDFINGVSNNQNRYLQKESRRSKAIFNTYFAIRTPEEKYDERARVLNAYDWKNNEILNSSFQFLDI